MVELATDEGTGFGFSAIRFALEDGFRVERLLDGADLCMGSRFQGGIKPGAMPWKNRYIGNPALTGILNLFFRTGVDDAHCGLRAIRREAYAALALESTGMEFASEMLIKASLRGISIAEVARWPRPVVVTFYHAALNRGWLVPTLNPAETP